MTDRSIVSRRNFTIVAALAVIGALSAGLWMASDRMGQPAIAPGRHASVEIASASAPVSAKGHANAAADSSASALARRTPVIKASRSDIARRYETSTDYRRLYDELIASEDVEAPHFAWKMLRHCMDVSRWGLAATIKKFEKEAAMGAVSLVDQRIDAFRRMKAPCAGFEDLRFSSEDRDALQRKGASRGDPRASASLLPLSELDTRAAFADPVATAASFLATNDPYVFVALLPFMARKAGGGRSVDGRSIDEHDAFAYDLAWQMIACDYGFDCGSSSELVLVGCAFNSYCGRASFEDLVRSGYARDDAEYQRALDLRSRIFDALERKDYASLGLHSKKESPSRR